MFYYSVHAGTVRGVDLHKHLTLKASMDLWASGYCLTVVRFAVNGDFVVVLMAMRNAGDVTLESGAFVFF